MKRVLRKILRVFLICLAAVIGLASLLTATNLTMTAVERHRYPAPGMMVESGGTRMHVYARGAGAMNVVLLSGYGVAGPAVDFGPLVRVLSRDFTACVVEYPGYGWSGWTRAPRTNKNIVEETRGALRDAGILPPYILVPHSISGLYSLYYALKYPSEVQAVVGLDSSLPAQAPGWKGQEFSLVPVLMRVMGFVRAAFLVNPGLLGLESPAYSDTDRKMMAMMYCWNFSDGPQMSETQNLLSNAEELAGRTYPREVPIRFVLAHDSIGPETKGPSEWRIFHEQAIEGNMNGKIYVLEGNHFIYRNNVEAVAAIIRETSLLVRGHADKK